MNGDRDDDVHPPQLKDTQDRPGGIHVHLRSMVVRWVGSSTKMEQDAPATPGESAAWFLIDLLVHGELVLEIIEIEIIPLYKVICPPSVSPCIIKSYELEFYSRNRFFQRARGGYQ